ncbi:MAG: hypothetical protein HY717_20485 [Planctomycetes bacterium]|nr:hypothetical protein [Planctomycetota bacterium]
MIFLLTVLLLAQEPAPNQGAFTASRRPDGAVQLALRCAGRDYPLAPELSGTAWYPFGPRGAAAALEAAQAPAVREILGDLPRLEVRSEYQLFACRAVKPEETDTAGFAAVGSFGVRVLALSPGGRYRLASEGAALAPSGNCLGAVTRGLETEEVFLFDLAGSQPILHPVSFEPPLKKIEPRSLTLTSSAAFFAAEREQSGWLVFRVPLPAAAGPESLKAESIAGPFDKVSPYMAASESAVLFLAGSGGDELDVFAANGIGPALNVTAAPAEYLEHAPASARLAISAGGDLISYNLKVGGEPEVFIHDVAIPGPAGRRQVTADERFNPYIDQESWIFFNRSGRLVFAAGHDPVTTDLYRVNPADLNDALNLTLTGAGPYPPFLTKGTLAMDQVIAASADLVLVSAIGFAAGEPAGVAGISMATGERLFWKPGLKSLDHLFAIGSDLYFTAARPDGSQGFYRLHGQALEELGAAPAGAAPRPLVIWKDRALFFLPGAGILDLLPGEEPRLLAAAPEIAPAAALDTGGSYLLFGRPAPDGGGYVYAWLDLATGSERPFDPLPSAGVALAVNQALRLFIRGDANLDGSIDISDAVVELLYLFLGRGQIECLDAADANDDGEVSITDPIHLLLFLFQQGEAPAPPFPELGIDPIPDGLSCPAL